MYEKDYNLLPPLHSRPVPPLRTFEHHVSQDAARCQARLAVIIETWNKDGCYEHGEECQDRATCLAREIIARARAWL